ncbi:S-adenosyl-L-methionine-dependent methyltransferase [Plenodomus tracheiphilus IPT5]|uniref:S-adenosyl-L-methionine-dependent methyltransferase n=1 Tax=Plenodomus tracheiphilus IPT5 TaxID=1408161 RepID=A0A6A7BAF2_9PLEO|nr:S-adenosyl-L-methionine-dependent methyltransferase [Plenodomus tracheiphilus IPT5]
MAKLPKPPKSISAKSTALPASKTLPLPLQQRIQQQKPRQRPPRPAFEPLPPRSQLTPPEEIKKAWAARPRLSDLQKLSDEELKSAYHQAKVNKWRQRAFFGVSLAAFGLGMYGVMLYISISTETPIVDLAEDLSDRFDKEAEGYDEKVSLTETTMLLNWRRKKLTQMAKGHVLEVAVGTGRNIPYYNTKQCATVTLLDSSGPMLEVAKRKWNDTHKEYFSRVFFKQQSAIDPIIPPWDVQQGYDTVIQTMGLCSTPEPVKLLQNLEASTNEDGQILLLEHGKSHYNWLNNILDKTAPAHANEHGCWWNKDIGKIVEESGLEVVNLRRYNFGTTWWLELKPRKGLRKELTKKAAAVVEKATEEQAGAPVAQQKSWWSLWR